MACWRDCNPYTDTRRRGDELTMATAYSLTVQPVVDSIVDAVEDLVARVPPSREKTTDAPSTVARAIARKAAVRAAAVSGALALPPGVFGLLTVLPDLVAIWRIQAQMVADVAGVYGKEMQLTRTHMLYCLFRHASSQVARDVVVRAGERFVVRQLSGGALKSVLTSIGISVTQRVAGTTASRWIPVIGAAAVAGYAYFDTLQVARTAIRLLENVSEEAAAS
jgi:EcsC protein family